MKRQITRILAATGFCAFALALVTPASAAVRRTTTSTPPPTTTESGSLIVSPP